MLTQIVCEDKDGNIDYGYGFGIQDLDFNSLKEFIKLHKHSLVNTLNKEDIDYIIDTANYDNLHEYLYNSDYCCENSCILGIGALISNVMSEETGIRFSCLTQGDNNRFSYLNQAIIFPLMSPWEYNRVEKSLTEEKLEEIIFNYVKELNL